MKKVNKTTARNLFNAGIEVMFCPCKMRPERFGVWVSNKVGRAFDNLVNEFEFYNCSRPTGSYTAFYLKET